ncbi:MAG TPA: SRPBCC family protein [Anaerolineales bacterium]|jgi:uncharacterized protein YndB with AHSA1/START domain
MSAIKNKTVVTVEPGKQQVLVSREFDAPRELVFRAYTDPALFVQWLGPRGYSTQLITFEPVSGGRWRFVQKDQNGNEFGFHGVNHEVLANQRIIDTFEFEGLPESGHVILETTTFSDLPGGRTRIEVQSVFQSLEDRDGMVNMGMEHGMVESHERLDELLEQFKRR